MVGRCAVGAGAVLWMSALVAGASLPPSVPQALRHPPASALFQPSDTCKACHNNLVTRSGQDVSIFTDWSASMMANSARDPYWMAAVRREVMEYPEAREDIEHECSICHMPMTTFPERAAGRKGRVFDHLPAGRLDDPDAALASDGVSCTVCHQIQPTNLGSPASFTGGYVIDVTAAPGDRRVFGPFQVDAGRTRVMQSSSGFMPSESTHVQQSELCATCHTLYTHALAAGAGGVRLPEQTPYLEWQQSSFKDTQSCQSCHMPVVEEEVPLTRVLGQPRQGLSRHTFRGGNFFMMKLLNRFRDELGVRATAGQMSDAIARTERHLQEDTATVSATLVERENDTLVVNVEVTNLAGHKFPTAYPSRRAWLHVAVRDGRGRVIFESGAFSADGSVAGNDNDEDAARFEPHYAEITQPDQVQVYESILADPSGRVTTGLLSSARFAKDNRLLPGGMDKPSAPPDVAVHGRAAQDDDFAGGGDRVVYRMPLRGAGGRLTVTVELWFQPIGYRWAVNFRNFDAPEPRRFLGYWDAMSSESALMIAQTSLIAR